MDCNIVSQKFVKILFTPYTAPLTEENWEALAIHISLENNTLKTPDQTRIMRVSRTMHSIPISLPNNNVNP